MKEIILETRELTHIYAKGTPYEKTAVNGMNIKIEKGELVGIIGHTGSGKSTLVQHFNGLLKPDGGQIFLDGHDMWENKADIRKVRFKVGVCFQYPEYQLFEETVYKDIAFGPKNMGLDKDEINRRVIEAMKYVGLDESYADKSAFDLSGGEKRRAAIAGVMAMSPEVLILDEPCAGLDPAGRDMLLSLIKNYRESTGSTVIFVSHNMDDIAKIATRVLVVNDGKEAMYGTVDEVFSRCDELKAMGLDVPAVTDLFMKLKMIYPQLDAGVYDINKAADILYSLLKGGAVRA
ncbi:MAG: energy-coupling factor transporter ATPase [Clostridia bacterium]|nr:energy-coupling factor transporter ATPase [Clostridia bacterium]